MLIDDDIGHARLITKNLRRARCLYSIHHFDDGHSALDHLFCKEKQVAGSISKPSLILLDLNLPGCDGFEILKKLKTDSLLRIIPIIVFSTTDNPAELTRCYQLGASFFINKPVEYLKFSETIQKLGNLLHIFKLPKAL
jgi:CheY-like chemotaxis protein